MSGRKRPSFLRPLTQIAPQPTTKSENGVSALRDAELGPTSKGSIASAAYGTRPRSKSLANKEVQPGHAAPASSLGSRPGSFVGSPAASAASSRRSSFAPGHRRPSMSAREPTISRRGSLWSEYADEVPAGGYERTDKEKAEEAQKAFYNSTKLLWDSGVDKIAVELWSSFSSGWKKGDIVALFSVDNLGLSRLEHAHVLVLIDELQSQLQELAIATLSHPQAANALGAPTAESIDSLISSVVASPTHVALFLRALDTFSKVLLRTLPTFAERLEAPDSVTDILECLLNLVTFLTGSSTDLRRAIGSGFSLIAQVRAVVENLSRAVVGIVGTLPTSSPINVHPNGTFLFSAEHTLTQFIEIREHLDILLAQPGYASASQIFRKELRSMWNGLVGNARVARASRGVERIWENPTNSFKDKVASLLPAFDVIGWELDPISSETDEFSYSFATLRPNLASLLPADIAFSYGTAVGATLVSPTVVTLRGLRLVIDSASYDITKRGLLGFTDSGIASVVLPFDLELSFEESGHPKITAKSGKLEITLESSQKGDGVVGKVWNAWLSTVVKAKIAESVEERIASAFESWLGPLYAPAGSRVPAVPKTALSNPTNKETLASPPTAPSARLSSGPSGARAAFLASLRMTSGISVRPLATGRDVLDSLENPFGSGPNSAAVADSQDDEEGSVSGGLKSRRMSMAMSLTDLSRSDSTAFETIANPPRAQSASNLFLEETSAPLPRRLSMAYTPAGEPSLDDYDAAYVPATAHAPASRQATMADFLDDKSEADGTTIEGMLAAAERAKAKHGFVDPAEGAGRQNLSMADVTRDLEGITEASSVTPTPPVAYSRASYDAPPPAIRRKSMSEYLNEAAMVDMTDPTLNPGSRRAPDEDVDAPHELAPTMSSTLDAVSSVDVTLPQNIATPPRSRHSSFASDAFGGAGNSRRPRSKSFLALHDNPSMSEIGIDERVTRDETEVSAVSTASKSRRSSAAEVVYEGLDPAEHKKRTMSSWMSDATNVDATLLENIRNPASVDQTYREVAALPHSLASRRASLASSHVG